jgi:hypothetical protein
MAEEEKKEKEKKKMRLFGINLVASKNKGNFDKLQF